MRYSERQLHCLSAMGLVAWQLRAPAVARTTPAVELSVRELVAEPSADAPVPSADPAIESLVPTPAVPPAGSSSDAPAEPPAAPSVEPPSVRALAPELAPLAAPRPLAAPLPREPAALAAWLPAQPLAPFVYRERTITRVGRDDAPLLVVVERAAPASGDPAGTLPLAGDPAELFERMLRAIGLTRRETCQCVLSDVPQPHGDTVATLAGIAPRRAMLVLLQELDDGLDAQACRLDDGGTGVAWCLPHPERLLVDPFRKRQAWLVLKALRRHLASGP